MEREQKEQRRIELQKEQIEKRKQKELEAARLAYIRAHPHVYFINLPEGIVQTSRRTGRDQPMEVVNFEEDTDVKRALNAKPEKAPEKDFMQINKHRVELISAGAKAFSQLQQAPNQVALPLKSTLTQMIFDSRETKAKTQLVEKLEEKIEEEQKKEEDLKMMEEMYGLLEKVESEKPEEPKKFLERKNSTTSSVNTQYIDEQIRRYENSQEMQKWKGAFDRTMAKKFPGMASRREDREASTMRAYDIFKARHGILREQDNKPVLTFI